MSVELSMLKHFCDNRTLENAHHAYLDVLDNMEREVRLLFELVHSYYQEFDKESISHDELLGYYDLKYPKARERDMHLELMAQAYSSKVSEDLMKAHLDQMIERHNATSIINKLIPVMEGDKYGVLDSVRDDIDRHVDLLHNPPERLAVPEPCKKTLAELIEQEIDDAGIPWHIPALTDIIGGLRRKTLGLVYAFVDSGKTSFAMASVAHFAEYLKDTNDCICYCGNEESKDRLQLRLYQAMTNWTRGQVRKKRPEAEAYAKEHGLNNVHIFDGIETGGQIEYILREYKPHMLYIDLISDVEVETRRKAEGVSYSEQLFKWYRRTANNYNVGIIGATQGVGEAEDKKWLKLSDIYGSRVAIQRSLDWALGIGRKVNNPIDDELRYLNVPKNKLHDGDGGKITVHFNKYLCSWEVN